MNVAIVAGVIVANDAISNAALAQAKVLESIVGVEEVTLFAQHFGMALGPRARVTLNAWDLLRDPAFRRADLVIFHWGIYYDSFNAILPALNERSCVVHFHNCTPKSLVPRSQHATIDRSIEQLHHAVSVGPTFWTYSEYNRITLESIGVQRSNVRFVPFPIPFPDPMPTRPDDGDHITFMNVSRLVPQKAQHVMIEAVQLLPAQLRQRTRVRFVGSIRFSDEAYVSRLRTEIFRESLSDSFTIIEDPDYAELWNLYRRTDVVVSTSLHEGFCVPIVEGYAAGCRAIGTTAGNLPYLVAPGDALVEPLDAKALSQAMTEEFARGKAGEPGGIRRQIAERYSEQAAKTSLSSALFGDD